MLISKSRSLTEQIPWSTVASLYLYAKKLCSVLSLPLTLHYSLAPKLQRIKQIDSEHHKYDNAPVEVSLVAAVVVVLKMVYGLDGKKRCVEAPSLFRYPF